MDSPVALAPMAGISDLPYRVICRKFGCGLTVSEMVSAKGLLYKNEKTYAMLQIDEAERPTAIQLFGSVPEELAEAARIVEARGADIIDFNMGCPVPKVVLFLLTGIYLMVFHHGTKGVIVASFSLIAWIQPLILVAIQQ